MSNANLEAMSMFQTKNKQRPFLHLFNDLLTGWEFLEGLRLGFGAKTQSLMQKMVA